MDRDVDATSSGPVRKRANKGTVHVLPEDDEPIIEEEVDPTQPPRISAEGLLQFEFLAEARQTYEALRHTPLLATRTIDWDILRRYGQYDRMQAIIPARWGTQYSISVAQFAVRMGFYTDEETTQPIFTDSYRTVSVQEGWGGIDPGVLKSWWTTIGSFTYSGRSAGSHIRDPVHRYLHRVISNTIQARYEGIEKVTQDDLLVLYCLLHPAEGNIAYILLRSLARKRAKAARICQGPYITMIARAFGILDRFILQTLVPGARTSRISELDMIQMSILTATEPRQFSDPIDAAIAIAVDDTETETRRRPPPIPRSSRTSQASSSSSAEPSLIDEFRAFREEVTTSLDWIMRSVRTIAAARGVELPRHPSDPPPDDPPAGEH
ncbi:hypothetical protein M8C21_002735 [Ambrosia artemisiifolia]|uniref:Arabidopsis retrotransposon Orf1 C-terminal domain-containing protein n=1 Tax=Ambrosia artemisiifolia TaxID=4212 RepID=A0AAD5C3X4_AMBAR|nr:hypothetical protein M8C21_002735 [Ambrosia artemisiifolia]